MSGIETDTKNRWLETLSKNDPSNRIEYDKALAYVQQNFMEVMIFLIIFFNLNDNYFIEIVYAVLVLQRQFVFAFGTRSISRNTRFRRSQR